VGLMAAGLFLLGILLVLFSRSLSPGNMLSAADGIFDTPFFAEQSPPDFVRPSNPLLFDQVYQFIPWRYLAWSSLREGRLPLWNPYSYSGTPFVATMQSAVFYPINLLLTALPFESTFAWSAIIRLWIAGISTFVLCRKYQLRWIPSLISAISFMLSAYLVVWLGHPHTNVAVWLPALILCGELLVAVNDRRRVVGTLALTSLVIGVQFTGGHIETSVDILFAAGLYLLIRWWQLCARQKDTLRRKVAPLARAAAALVLGIGIGAAQLFPFLEWLPLSSFFHERASLGFQWLNPQTWRHLLSLPLLVFPNLYNNPTWPYPYWSFLLNWSDFNNLAVYLGTLPLILACIAIVHWFRQRSALVTTWGLLALISFGRAFYVPVFDWLNHLPGLSLGYAPRLRLILSFSLCLLAGFGTQLLLDQLRQREGSAARLFRRLCLVVAISGLLIMLASNAVLPFVRDRVAEYGKRAAAQEFAQRTAHSHTLEYYYQRVDNMVEGLAAAFGPRSVGMYAPVIWACLGLILLDRRVQRAVPDSSLGYALAVLVTLDLLTFSLRTNPVLPRAYLYPSSALATTVQEDRDLFRVMSLQLDLIPDAHMMLGLNEIRGLDFPTRWYDTYMSLAPERLSFLAYGMVFSSYRSPLLRLLNLKYISASDPERFAGDESVEVRQFGNMYLARLREVRPRAWLADSATAVRSDDEAKSILQNATDDSLDAIVITDSHAESMTERDQTADVTEGNVSLIHYLPESSAWQVETDREAFLFLSDAYYPGWKASIDGKEVPIARANLAFRAVRVPRGSHTVSFWFAPLSIYLGLGVTGSALLITGLLILLVALPATGRAARGRQQSS
jgi:hypothetical protein